MSLGAYLQCYKNPYATYQCLQSFRTHYPHATIVLLSDNGYDYTEMAKHFGCIYIHAPEQILLTLKLEDDYITESCKLIERMEKVLPLIPEEYFMWLEDDVSVNGVIHDTFRYDLNGYCPNVFNDIWKIDMPGIYRWSGHGGSVFHKERLLTYFKNKPIIQDILVNWKTYHLTANVGQDFFWSLIIVLNGGTVGPYEGHADCDYKNESITVQHQYKVWYGVPIPEELNQLVSQEVFISIGPYCSSTAMMRNASVRKQSYPFDHIHSSLSMIEHCLEDKFETFLNDELLYTNSYLYEVNQVHPSETLSSNRFYEPYLQHETILQNLSVPCIPVFRHHNLTNPETKETYTRRCKRLLDTLKDGRKKIFVYTIKVGDYEKELEHFSNYIQKWTTDFRILVFRISQPESVSHSGKITTYTIADEASGSLLLSKYRFNS